MKVWIVTERCEIPEDGNDYLEVIAVHATEAGARANLTPDPKTAIVNGARVRDCYETELLP